MARSRRPAPASELRSDRIIRFCEMYLVIPEGAHVGRKVVLREWQRDIIRQIYDQETRRAIISMSRKNGKTAVIAMLLLCHLVGPEARQNAQIYSAAQSREQASIVFSLAAKMVRLSPDLSKHVVVRDTAKELFCTLTGVKYRALSADATTAYGLSPALAIHDELGQVVGPRSELYDALETAMGAQSDPLSIVISTQAATDADLLSTLIDDARTGADPRTRLIVFEAPAEADPWAEETWRLANPALGDFRSLRDMQDAAERAKRLPAFENAFRNLMLNQRVASQNAFLSPDVWRLNGGEPDLSAFEDGEVYGGLDLSSRLDLTALILVTRGIDGLTHVRCEFWAPASGLVERAERDRAPYDLWRDQGMLIATPGKSVDYGWVAQRLAELASQMNIRAIRYDRWRINDLKREIERIGADVPLVEHGQGYRDMTPALEELESLCVDGRLRHGMHPILTWCAANAIATSDPSGNRKLDKSRSSGRIDGLVALAMAVGAVSQAPMAMPASIYETRDMVTL